MAEKTSWKCDKSEEKQLLGFVRYMMSFICVSWVCQTNTWKVLDTFNG